MLIFCASSCGKGGSAQCVAKSKNTFLLSDSCHRQMKAVNKIGYQNQYLDFLAFWIDSFLQLFIKCTNMLQAAPYLQKITQASYTYFPQDTFTVWIVNLRLQKQRSLGAVQELRWNLLVKPKSINCRPIQCSAEIHQRFWLRQSLLKRSLNRRCSSSHSEITRNLRI